MHNDSDISTTTGNIAINGIGGNGTNNNRGIHLLDNDVSITTTDGSISLTGTGGTATGSQNYGIYLNTGPTLQTTTGDITLTGTGGGTGGGSGENSGVRIYASSVTSQDGDILLTGQGALAAGGWYNIGVDIYGGTTVTSTGTGAGAGPITLNGTGGAGAPFNDGVSIVGLLTSVDGNILITGSGGTASGVGIFLDADSEVNSTGAGAEAANITLNGTAQNSGSHGLYGVQLRDARINTIDGDIAVTGESNATGTNNAGLILHNDADITSTGAGAGAGNIVLIGTGGDGGGGQSDNYGVYIGDAGTTVSVARGNASITGTGGTGTAGSNYGVILGDSGAVTSSNAGALTITGTEGGTSGEAILVIVGANVIGGAAAGDVTLTGNTMNFANLTGSSAGNITLQTRTAGTTVGLAGGAGVLDLTAAELNFFNPGGAFILGAANSGNLTVNARNWGGEDVQFRTGGAGVINVAGAQTNIADFTITTDADPTIGAAITGTGVLTLEPATAATTMGLGGGAGALNYANADLTALGATWSSYVFGSTTQTGALTAAAHTWSNPVTWRSAAGGNILIGGLQDTTAASAAIFTFDGPVTLSANVSTVGGDGRHAGHRLQRPRDAGRERAGAGGGGRHHLRRHD